MEKFSSYEHSMLQEKLPFSYFSTNLYLDFSAYTFNRNDEALIVWQDILYPNEFPCIFLPKRKENWVRCSTALTTEEDIKDVEKEHIEILMKKLSGSEFFYETNNFTIIKGDFKNRVNKFASSYKYSLSNKIGKEKIVEFYEFWKSQREHKSITFDESEEFFNFCLDNLDKYTIKQVYALSDNKIIGLAWGIAFPHSNNWIGLHLKVDYNYKGLSRFLQHERAKMFQGFKEFSLGTGANDENIEKYKEELGPTSKKEYYFLLTGNKKDLA